ncbi:hypothetical protein Vadar_011108 [Vaccinium darrowii]|uniref:Uncharacterized protein n=1 Tax=Vaccinium darrowii TaxID=229202 RepID=A0ACB7XGQ3_9ERIC|nr:hypothetical protein Vadar_011108 [Vaccinium darrowii]
MLSSHSPPEFLFPSLIYGLWTKTSILLPRTSVVLDAHAEGNKSSGLRKEEVSKFMVLVDNKSLVSLTTPQDLPPAQAPKPVSTETNVVEPPVPSVGSKAIPPFDGRNRFISSAPPPKPNEQSKSPADKYINILIILFIVMGVLVATFVIGVIFVTILAFVSQWACPRLREWLRGFGI